MKATAQIDVSLTVDCPHCNEQNNLLNNHHDCDGEITTKCFSDWSLFDEDFQCEFCEKEFNVNNIEY